MTIYIKFSQKEWRNITVKVQLPDQNFTVFLHFYIVLAPATPKTSVYRISFKSIYFYYFAPPRCFEFLSYEL